MSPKMENSQNDHFLGSTRQWNAPQMPINWKETPLQHNERAKTHLCGLNHRENQWFLTSNRRFSRNFQDFSGRGIQMGVGSTPKVAVRTKDTGFERFVSILDDPENLSKKYYQRSEKSCN